MPSQISSSEYLKRIILKLRSTREAANLSQTNIAALLNISLRTYQRIESGEVAPDYVFLINFAKIVKVDFTELVTPYAPDCKKIVLYKSEEEQRQFEEMPFVIETHFQYWVSLFEEKKMSLGESDEFKNFQSPLLLRSVSQKMTVSIANDVHRYHLKNLKLTRTSSPYVQIPSDRLNALDCLLFYCPKFSIFRRLNESENGVLEIYSSYIFLLDEFLILSVLKLDV